MEIKDFVDGADYTEESQVRYRLEEIRKRMHSLKGFLKGLEYNKDRNINSNWEYDLNFIDCILKDLLRKPKESGGADGN